MQCPVDNTTLVMSERQGIEIDYCPDCRGVWLDRGEIDKIIERSLTDESPRGNSDSRNDQRDSRPPTYDDRREHRSERRDHDDDDDHRGEYNQGGHHKKRKESFFSDLFE